MKKIYVCVGLPGSGKSTYFKENFFGKESIIRINADKVRRVLYYETTGKTFDESKEPEVWEKVWEELEIYSEKGFDIYFDATNLTYKRRFELQARMWNKGYKRIYLHFQSDLDTVKNRNRNKDRGDWVVPEDKMDFMSKIYKPIEKWEYDTKINIVDVDWED